MAKQNDFNSFISNIEPSKTTVDYISGIQSNLRTYLKSHEKYSSIHKDTFLSGSYAKHTSIRPASGDKKRDVDIIVVTSYGKDNNSIEVINEIKNVLAEKEIYKNAVVQSHSVGIMLGDISVDVVPVIKDVDDDSLYYIGDSKTGGWTKADPKGHIAWSTQINTNHNNKFKSLVKIFKWWRRANCPNGKKYPKGITLEKIIADNLGDSSLSTENFLIETMENIVSSYKEDYVDLQMNPCVNDPSDKICDNDLLSGYDINDFGGFILKINEHIELLNSHGTTNNVWREILGEEFPNETIQLSLNSDKVSTCLFAQHRQKPIWPIQRGGGAFISAKSISPSGENVEIISGDKLIKGCDLHFTAITSVKQPYYVMWQIVNTGDEAAKEMCLRGGFEASDEGERGKHEATKYTGLHMIQCFIIKNKVCVAKSKEFIVNIQ